MKDSDVRCFLLAGDTDGSADWLNQMGFDVATVMFPAGSALRSSLLANLSFPSDVMQFIGRVVGNASPDSFDSSLKGFPCPWILREGSLHFALRVLHECRF